MGSLRLLALLLSLAIVPARAGDQVPAALSVCFTPPERCGMRVAAAILAARQSVRMQAYGFDDPPIVAALLADHRRGVDVQILLDRANEHRRWSALPRMLAAGVPVLIDDRPAIAHNKIVIVDACLVIGGSFNYTRSADERNAENVTFVAGCRAAAPFLANWQRRRAVSRPPGAETPAD